NFDASHNYLHQLDKDFTGYLEYLTAEGERKAIIRVENARPVRKYRGRPQAHKGEFRSKQ
ncbi:hypothetical protein, partial [Sinomicrobium soli]|uniref:hypothetical protein n=1 Tax=Sinomicrobium sp. N-1-3-6 TaxID=2219864 RepID=UPI000DCED248